MAWPVIDRWRNREFVFARRQYRAEQLLAATIKNHAANWDGRDYPIKDIATFAPDIELTEMQIAALQTAFTHPISIVTGGPGTRKTTILKTLAALVGAERITACSVAGLAASRIYEATRIPTQTIHRTIKMFPGGTRFHDHDPDEFCIKTDFLVVDECSMIDIYLFQKLLEECAPHTRIVLVGDVDQLGPIAAGQPFADLIMSELFPVTRLDQVFRFAEGGAIAEAARRGAGSGAGGG